MTINLIDCDLIESCAAWQYEHKWWNRELILKCKLKFYVKPMKDPLGVSTSKGNQGTTRGKEKILLTSMGIETTTSGLDLPGLPWVSYSTLIYTSEFILSSTICVHSAARHNIHMYPYFLFAAIHHLNRPRLSLFDLVAQSAA